MFKSPTWLELNRQLEKLQWEHQHCLRMKPEGQQQQEQGLGIREAKSQGQMEDPGGTGWVLLHEEKSGDIKSQLNS